MRSAETRGMRSMLRKTSHRPITSRATGRANVPHPATVRSSSSQAPVKLLFWLETRLRKVSRPTRARRMPRMSSLRSGERLPNALEEVRRAGRGALVWRVGFCAGREERLLEERLGAGRAVLLDARDDVDLEDLELVFGTNPSR